jgi:hypothetical protein
VTPWLTVVIPTRKRAHGQHQALAFHATASGKIDTLVIDGTASLVQKWKAGVDASNTPWVLLAADDLTVSHGWDSALHDAAANADGPTLLHVDDGYFRERLSITPCLNREAVAAFRWPSEYAHYRIDDHIFDIFHQAQRVTYLPHVQLLHAREVPEAAQYAIDNATFHRLQPERDEAVARLLRRPVELITPHG